MGTNYYAHINKCKCCGKAEEVIHIGKTSYGWRFGLDVSENNIEYFTDYKSFKKFIHSEDIDLLNEYGDRVTLELLYATIEERKDKQGHEDHAKSVDGPVDLIDTEFS